MMMLEKDMNILDQDVYIKSKCILNIVPKTYTNKSFEIDPKCIIKKK